jgi:hypothetical protein
MSDLRSALDALEALVQPTAAPAPLPSPTAPVQRRSALPGFAEITVANVYLFDNGVDAKWRRYVVNLQLFTETQPFTPDVTNAAYCGTAILRHPDVFGNVMAEYVREREDTFPQELWRPRYLDQIQRANALPTMSTMPDFPRIGQLEAQGAGRNYELGSLVRAHVTEHSGLNIDLLLLDGTIPFVDFRTNPPGNKKPIAYASYDPHRLWVPKVRTRRTKVA